MIYTAIFLVEAIIKIIATGSLYFQDTWNLFDFLITILSIVTILLDQFDVVSVGGSMLVVRAFRIAKILRLVRRTKSLRYIFKTFIHCLKPLANIGSLLLLILYMYTIVGVYLFG
jgi:Ion transport protein